MSERKISESSPSCVRCIEAVALRVGRKLSKMNKKDTIAKSKDGM